MWKQWIYHKRISQSQGNLGITHKLITHLAIITEVWRIFILSKQVQLKIQVKKLAENKKIKASMTI